jgi:hypothetical protein
MSKLETLLPNSTVKGILPDSLVTVVNVQWFGSTALELIYETTTGKVANELLYRHDEQRIEVVELGRPWSFDGDGALFRLVRKPTVYDWPICSTRYLQSIHHWSSHCRTK